MRVHPPKSWRYPWTPGLVAEGVSKAMQLQAISLQPLCPCAQFLTRPFVVGDRIEVKTTGGGTVLVGTVEKIDVMRTVVRAHCRQSPRSLRRCGEGSTPCAPWRALTDRSHKCSGSVEGAECLMGACSPLRPGSTLQQGGGMCAAISCTHGRTWCCGGKAPLSFGVVAGSLQQRELSACSVSLRVWTGCPLPDSKGVAMLCVSALASLIGLGRWHAQRFSQGVMKGVAWGRSAGAHGQGRPCLRPQQVRSLLTATLPGAARSCPF